MVDSMGFRQAEEEFSVKIFYSQLLIRLNGSIFSVVPQGVLLSFRVPLFLGRRLAQLYRCRIPSVHGKLSRPNHIKISWSPNVINLLKYTEGPHILFFQYSSGSRVLETNPRFLWPWTSPTLRVIAHRPERGKHESSAASILKSLIYNLWSSRNLLQILLRHLRLFVLSISHLEGYECISAHTRHIYNQTS